MKHILKNNRGSSTIINTVGENKYWLNHFISKKSSNLLTLLPFKVVSVFLAKLSFFYENIKEMNIQLKLG